MESLGCGAARLLAQYSAATPRPFVLFFFFNDTAPTEIYTLSLHDALPILMLPGMNGLEVLRALRQSCNTPLLMLSARGEPVDRILGLELGADDYLAKPADPRELVARLRALLRRSAAGSDAPVLEVGDLRMDTASLMCWQDDELLPLTQTEALILRTLLEHAGQLVDRQSLSRQALGKPLGPYDRSLDMHISNLRRKLGSFADGRNRIQSIRGRGYLYG